MEFTTFVHEYAHELLHGADDRPTSRDTRELEAEDVAFVVGHDIGLHVADASPRLTSICTVETEPRWLRLSPACNRRRLRFFRPLTVMRPCRPQADRGANDPVADSVQRGDDRDTRRVYDVTESAFGVRGTTSMVAIVRLDPVT
jgi:hypothetical protein